MKNGRMQAKDIDDREFLSVIRECSTLPWGSGMPNEKGYRWVHTWDIEAARPDWPYPVFQAKAKALIRRKLLSGCPCGCRGDYELTLEGWGFIGLKPPEDVVGLMVELRPAGNKP